MKNVFKCSAYLLARLILVAMLSFMTIPLSSQAPDILNPIMAIFYTFMLIYFFVLTMWHEGGKDANRVEINTMQPMLYKGFLSAAITTVPLMLVNVITLFIGDETQSVIANALRIIKVIFAFVTSYAITLFTSTTDDAILSGEQTLASDAIIAVVVFCVLLTAALVSAGIGYIVGYRRILIFKPIIDKILRRTK